MRFSGVRLLQGLVVLIVLVVAAAAAWWFFIREDNELATSAPDIPKDLASATAPPGTSPAAGGAAASGRYRIIPEQSEAAYFADEKFATVSLPSTAKGTTRAIQGELFLTADGLDPSRESKFSVDLRTLKSDQDQRDRQVQGNGLETARFPTATFTAKKLEGFPREFPAGQEVPMKLTGTLDLHGVQKEVTWDVLAKKEGTALSALATLNFRYADFNIPVLNIANFVSVEEDVTLQVKIIATQG